MATISALADCLQTELTTLQRMAEGLAVSMNIANAKGDFSSLVKLSAERRATLRQIAAVTVEHAETQNSRETIR
jgi:hypothetical protein